MIDLVFGLLLWFCYLSYKHASLPVHLLAYGALLSVFIGVHQLQTLGSFTLLGIYLSITAFLLLKPLKQVIWFLNFIRHYCWFYVFMQYGNIR